MLPGFMKSKWQVCSCNQLSTTLFFPTVLNTTVNNTMNVLQERLSESALHLFVIASIFLQFISVLKLGIIIGTFEFLTLFKKFTNC